MAQARPGRPAVGCRPATAATAARAIRASTRASAAGPRCPRPAPTVVAGAGRRRARASVTAASGGPERARRASGFRRTRRFARRRGSGASDPSASAGGGVWGTSHGATAGANDASSARIGDCARSCAGGATSS